MSADSSTPIIPKAEAVAQRAAYRAERNQVARLHRKCFWTWPWGHVWKNDGRKELVWFYRCASCGKTRVDIP